MLNFRNDFSNTRKGGKGGRGATGRRAEEDVRLRADSGRLLAIACRRLPVRHGETEAVFPMKYSPRLSLKRRTERRMGGCACDRGREGWREGGERPQIWLMSAQQRHVCFTRWETRRTAGGPLNAHPQQSIVPNSTRAQSQEKKTH